MTIEPPATTTTPSTTKMDAQPAPETAPAPQTAPAEQAPAGGTQVQPQAPATNPDPDGRPHRGRRAFSGRDPVFERLDPRVI